MPTHHHWHYPLDGEIATLLLKPISCHFCPKALWKWAKFRSGLSSPTFLSWPGSGPKIMRMQLLQEVSWCHSCYRHECHSPCGITDFVNLMQCYFFCCWRHPYSVLGHVADCWDHVLFTLFGTRDCFLISMFQCSSLRSHKVPGMSSKPGCISCDYCSESLRKRREDCWCNIQNSTASFSYRIHFSPGAGITVQYMEEDRWVKSTDQ